MAAGFGISQGHQVNLGSLAADVLFEIMDHLSVVDVLRFRQAGIDFFPEKALLISLVSLVHPLHRSVHIFNGSHGTRLSGSVFSVASISRCRTFRVPFRLSPLLKLSASSVEQFPLIVTGHVHGPPVSHSIRTTSLTSSSSLQVVAISLLPRKIYVTTSMASSYGTRKLRTYQSPSPDIRPAPSCPTFSSSGSHGRERMASLLSCSGSSMEQKP